MAEVATRRWASVYANEDFVCFQTCSGFRRYASDPQGKLLFAKPQDAPQLLGQALTEALSSSRFLKPEEIPAFFDVSAIEQRYEEWVSALMQRFGYASKHALFRQMKHCQVDQGGGIITIKPTAHEKLEAWTGESIERTEHVQLPEGSSPQHVGEAVQLALSRCIA